MPYGILTDVAASLGGGILGCILGSRLSERWKTLLNNILGVAALVMGISASLLSGKRMRSTASQNTVK